MNISGLIQARMGSKRLPGKVMLEIESKPLIGHIFDRLREVKGLKEIILATTADKKNDILEKYALKENIIVYRHEDENDIVGRLYESFKLVKSDAILKINADCPLIDPFYLQEGLNIFSNSDNRLDLVTNKISKTFPDGYSFEIVSYKAIEWCHHNIKDSYNRELVMSWIMKNNKEFPRIYSIKNNKNFGNYNLCVDTLADFKKISFLFKRLYKNNKYFGLEDVMSFLK